MSSQNGGYPPKNANFWVFGAPTRPKMCCSIPNTILKDFKCVGESIQKISWTLLMIKDRQNGKNDLWGIFHNWWSLGRPIIPKKGVFEVWDWTSRTSKTFSIAFRIRLFVFEGFLLIISTHWNKRDCKLQAIFQRLLSVSQRAWSEDLKKRVSVKWWCDFNEPKKIF